MVCWIEKSLALSRLSRETEWQTPSGSRLPQQPSTLVRKEIYWIVHERQMEMNVLLYLVLMMVLIQISVHAVADSSFAVLINIPQTHLKIRIN